MCDFFAVILTKKGQSVNFGKILVENYLGISLFPPYLVTLYFNEVEENNVFLSYAWCCGFQSAAKCEHNF